MVKLEGREWSAGKGKITSTNGFRVVMNGVKGKRHDTFAEAVEELSPDTFIKTVAWDIVRDGKVTGGVAVRGDGFTMSEGEGVKYFETRAELVKSL